MQTTGGGELFPDGTFASERSQSLRKNNTPQRRTGRAREGTARAVDGRADGREGGSPLATGPPAGHGAPARSGEDAGTRTATTRVTGRYSTNWSYSPLFEGAEYSGDLRARQRPSPGKARGPAQAPRRTRGDGALVRFSCAGSVRARRGSAAGAPPPEIQSQGPAVFSGRSSSRETSRARMIRGQGGASPVPRDPAEGRPTTAIRASHPRDLPGVATRARRQRRAHLVRSETRGGAARSGNAPSRERAVKQEDDVEKEEVAVEVVRCACRRPRPSRKEKRPWRSGPQDRNGERRFRIAALRRRPRTRHGCAGRQSAFVVLRVY